MRKPVSHFVFTILSAFLLILSAGCSNQATSGKDYNFEQFESAMKEKKYDVKIQDGTQPIFSATYKIMTTGDASFNIYEFENNEEMENAAKGVSKDGFSIKTGSKSVNVDWVSTPHFYKKGKLIVIYIGKDKQYISNMEGLFGKQFAGME